MRKLKTALLAAAIAVTPVAVSVAAAAPAAASVTVAVFYTDWHYQGWSTGVGGGVDCDYSGYRFSWQHQSTLGATSSIGTYFNAPHCNTAKLYTTYGGQVLCYLPCSYVGDAANDQIVAVDVYRRAGT